MAATGIPESTTTHAVTSSTAHAIYSLGRLSRFGLVGASCLVFQLAILHLLLTLFSIDSRTGQNIANALAFLLSAQLNFLLSRAFTWADRPGNGRAGQRIAFNLLALVSLLINQIIFFLLAPRIGSLPASATGALVASGLALLISARLIFQRAGERQSAHDVGRSLLRGRSMPGLSLHTTWLARCWRSDPYQVVVVAGALISSIASYLYYLHQGHLLAYADSISHPMIARRIIDSPTPGLSQIGGVWLPLPHLAALPFIWSDWFYYSGTAGAIISMVSYVALLLFSYRTARALGCSQLASLVAPVVLALNPNMRYMQSVAMTELPLLLGTVMAIYYLIRWSQTESVWQMAGMICGVLIASATRYEGWALWAAAFAGIAFVMLRKGWSRAKQIDYALFYLVFAGLMIPGWALWNRVIIQSGWLGFTRGEYASSENWVSASEPSFGHPWVALKTYWYAMVHVAGIPLIIIAAAGLLIFLMRDRLAPGTSGVLILLFPIPFFWLMLWRGQRPLHVPEISDDMYNIRFALQMLPFFALMAALCAQAVMQRFDAPKQRQIAFAACLLIALIATPATAITLDEPIAAAATDDRRASQIAAGDWLAESYSGHGHVLMETPSNEITLFYSRLPLENVIYEGTNAKGLWENALTQPANHVEWIVMRTTPGSEDKVAQAMAANPDALNAFTLRYDFNGISVYQRTP